MSKYIIISFLILSILLSGCVEKTIIINADNYSKSVIQHIVDISDKNMTKYINSITVYEDTKLLNEKCKSIKSTNIFSNKNLVDQYVGCVDIKYNSDSNDADISSTDIFILSDNNLKEYCDSEGYTIAYLIGSMEHNKKYHNYYISYTGAKTEDYYNKEYANNIIKNKCDSDEAKNILNKLQSVQDKYNNSVKIYSDESNLSEDEYYLKWGDYILIENLPDKYIPDKYRPVCSNGYCKPVIMLSCEYSQFHCGIPQERYSEYTSDYNRYTNTTQKYSDLINSSFQEYSDNYDKISEEYNETLRNYRYPFVSTNMG